MLRDHRVPIRAKLMALGIGAECIGVLELLQLPLEAVLAGILPLTGITGDIAFNGAEAVVGPVIIATMLLPYLVPPILVRQIRAEGNEPALAALERLKDDEAFAPSLLWFELAESAAGERAPSTDHAGADGGGAEPRSGIAVAPRRPGRQRHNLAAGPRPQADNL